MEHAVSWVKLVVQLRTEDGTLDLHQGELPFPYNRGGGTTPWPASPSFTSPAIYHRFDHPVAPRVRGFGNYLVPQVPCAAMYVCKPGEWNGPECGP